ncbi:hypothetical protein M4951_22940 [Blastopirellula sp. J2-11]|uniref:hypothetical protein n=1 Tax=Blastopirellula sp. J2-11 TaxID=2943192 RepID=UPI0021C79DD8|nr:hypothetical protein [Blastopirellula sp. J2-11]UUO06199.1 hypothetical protein M4951_22940 [Blastopirellula sp. J2-11]
MSASSFSPTYSSILLLIATAVCLTGCSGENAVPVSAVAGKVTFNDQPVSEGTVSFMSDQGFGASAPLEADGTYQLRSQHGAGLPHGAYKVIVQPKEEEFLESERAPRKTQSSDIPAKYQEFATSGLEIVIDEKPQTFDIQLTK